MNNQFTDGLHETNEFVTNSDPLFPDVKKILPESAVMDIKLDLPDQTMIFDGYHSPFIGSTYLPELASIGPYVGKEYFSTNESFDSEWMKALPEQYGHEVYNEDDTGQSLDKLIGETTMQGYGITNKYTLSIFNAGSADRELIYSFSDFNEDKLKDNFCIRLFAYDNDGNEIRNSYVDVMSPIDGFGVNIYSGIWTNIEIYVSQWAGSNATIKNKFVIK